MRPGLVILILLAPFALAASPAAHTESRQYVGPTHDTSARVVDCKAPAPLALDGACFVLSGAERHASITIIDASGLAIGSHVFFRAENGITVGASDFICSSTWTADVPADAATLHVWLLPTPPDVGLSDIHCPLVHGQATTGTITATFS